MFLALVSPAPPGICTGKTGPPFENLINQSNNILKQKPKQNENKIFFTDVTGLNAF